jgi:hypothetical protein
MRTHKLPTLLMFAGLVACGGGGHDEPDANNNPDIDASNVTCSTETIGDPAIDGDAGDGSFIDWTAPGNEELDPGNTVRFQMEFYGSIEPSLVDTFDLTAGNQANYKTCALCFRAFSVAADGTTVTRQFFQSAGSITVTSDPLTGHLVATVTGLKMVEVTIAGDFTSTPVDGGGCVDFGDLSFDVDNVPTQWTCDHAAYNDGTNCDCACGTDDPDCGITDAPVVGCTGAQICVAAECTDTCDSLSSPQVGCTTGTCGFQTETQDICYTDATMIDNTAQVGDACAAGPLFCAVANTVANGICDTFVTDTDTCHHICNDTGDCTGLGEVCAPILTTKGVCVVPPANDTCGTALPLVVGTPVTGNTGGAVSDYNAGLEGATCTGFAQVGPDVAYSVTLTAGTAYTVALTAPTPDYDGSISLVGPGTSAVCDADPITTCVAGADAGFAGDPESFQFTPTATGLYFVIVDSFGGSGGYTLEVTSP